MRFPVLFFSLTAFLRAACTVPAAAFFVSPAGNDSWSGTLAAPNGGATDGPFLTLSKAQAAMRAGTAKTTVVRAGTYSVAAGWPFTQGDAGETWTAYPGEAAVFDGAGTGGIAATGTVSGLSFSDFTFRNFGAAGFNASYLSGLILRWNTFLNCFENCISGSGVTNAVIDSNTFNGQQPGNVAGTTLSAYSMVQLWYGSSGNRITHNLFTGAQGGAVNFSAGPNDPPNNNNIADRNLLKSVDTNVTDMGALYFYDMTHSATGNQITNNVVVGNGDAAHQTKAFYLDDGTSNTLVSGNICTGCGQWAWQIHAGDHNTVVNNIFDLSLAGSQIGLYQTDASSDRGMGNNVVSQNLVYWGSGTVPASLYQVNTVATDALPAVSKNLYYSTNGAQIPNGPTIVDASPVYANPQFAGPGSGNYTMPASSPAFTQAGFHALPADIGPQQPECPGQGTSGGFTGTRTVTSCSVNSSGTPSKCRNQTLNFLNGILQP